MKAILENIQGFKGYFEMHLNSNIINITSKYNGTGKTTFFECIKLLCYRNSLTDEELQYILNKDCSECMFKVRDMDIAYAFYYNRKHLVYTYEEADYPMQTQYTPFPEVQSFLNVMIKDGMFINVCDRFINLFSSSNEHINYDLISAIISHKKSDDFLVTLNNSLALNKEGLRILNNQLLYKEAELGRYKKYNNVDNLEELLNNNNIINLHDTLVDLKKHVDKFYIRQVLNDVSSLRILRDILCTLGKYKIISNNKYTLNYFNLIKLLRLRTLCYSYFLTNPKCLADLFELKSLLILVNKFDIIKFRGNRVDTQIKPLEMLSTLADKINQYNIVHFLDINLILTLRQVIALVNKYTVRQEEASMTPLTHLSNLCDTVSRYRGNIFNLENIETEREYIMSQIQPYRGQCNYCDEVYIIDGECYHI